MNKRKIYILGAARSGIASALLGKQKGYDVFVSDLRPIAPKLLQILQQHKIPYEQGAHKENPNNYDFIIKSPGIPNNVPVLKNISVPVYSEIEFASWFIDNRKIIAITGTNGKTTVTSLIAHLLNEGGKSAIACGNIGFPMASAVLKDYDYYVVEVSSFQAEHLEKFHPHIAVLTNLAPDHMKRYNGNFDAYVRAKMNLFKNMTPQDFLIYNADCEISKKYIKPLNVSLKSFALQNTEEAFAYIQEEQNKTYIIMKKKKRRTKTELANKNLQSMPNKYNSLAASIVGDLANLKKDYLKNAFKTYKMYPHRIELVAEANGIRFINDSKATNVNATWMALHETPAPIILLAGGVDKGQDLAPLLEPVKEKVKLLILIGKDNSLFQKTFSKYVRTEEFTDLNEAVRFAYKNAKTGDTIMLSPACASYDFYTSYEERGDAFKRAVSQTLETISE